MKNERLDARLSREAGISRAKAKALVEAGLVQVNGACICEPDARPEPASTLVWEKLPKPEELEATDGEISLLYHDDSLLVLNKPAGLTVHPAPSCPHNTLLQRLLAPFPQLREQEGMRPGIVHRLDKDTSGLLLVALQESARLALSASFAERDVHKTYLALCQGIPPATGRVDAPIGRHPTLKTRQAIVPLSQGGKPALTEWETLYISPTGRFALLKVRIYTGRTHQIRVHMAHAGFPLWKDALYAPRKGEFPPLPPSLASALAEHGFNPFPKAPPTAASLFSSTAPPQSQAPRPHHLPPLERQALHAFHIDFPHPVTKERMAFTCPPPEDFIGGALALSRTSTRLILTGVAGCGKSTVLQALAAWGFPIFSADACVAQLYEPGADGWQLLHQQFGGRFTPPNHPVDKKALANAFETEPHIRQAVEHLIHPLLFHRLNQFFNEHANQALTIAEIPLWFETAKRLLPPPSSASYPSGSSPLPTTVVVCIGAGTKARAGRLAMRGWDANRIAQTDAWQWSEDQKAKASDFVLDNSGSINALPAEIQRLWNFLLTREAHAEKEVLGEVESFWGQADVVRIS